MKKTTLIGAAAMLFTAGIVSAQNADFVNGFNYHELLNQQNIVAPQDHTFVAVPKPILEQLGPAEWTIMVFVNGKNNLEKYALRDVNEMEMIGSTDKVNIVVELGRMEGFDSSDGDWKGVRRYFVKKDKDTNKITSPVVQDLGMKDMGSYQSVIDFGKWAKQKYPAKNICSYSGTTAPAGSNQPDCTAPRVFPMMISPTITSIHPRWLRY